MALSNLNKTHLDDLLLSLNDNINESNNQLELVKSNHSQYSQLKLIAKQMEMLRNEARNIINSSNLQNELHNIKKTCKLVSGNYYYLYEKDTKKYFSIISPAEWISSNVNFSDSFLGKFYYDFDKQFIKK